jgi:alkaline phosphatase D
MASTPTYMILDDHEIEDNWPANRSHYDKALYKMPFALTKSISAATARRLSGCPDGTSTAGIEKYWYTFADGDTDWFVMDCRTAAHTEGSDKRRMLGVEQENALHLNG